MKSFQAEYKLENQNRWGILRLGENLCSDLYVMRGNKVQHSPQQINHIQLHSGKYKEIYLSMSYVTRRLLTMVENISHHLSF